MASSMTGGMFRESRKLKGRGKGEATPLPPPVSSEQYRRLDLSEASPSSNGPSKEEDHFGFLYSVSEKDFH